MPTVATITVPQVLVTAPIWTLFIAPGVIFAVLLPVVYRLSRSMSEGLACLLTFAPGIAVILICAPGVFEARGFEGTDVLNMTLGVIAASLILSIPLLALLEIVAPHILKLLRKVDATNGK